MPRPRSATCPPPQTSPATPDAGQVQGYAQPAMAWAVAEGIVEGMDGNLNPAGNASRAQIATILMRFCEDAAQ